MRRLAALLSLAVLLAAAAAIAQDAPRPAKTGEPPAAAPAEAAAPAPRPSSADRFLPVDIYLDAADRPLAAWQVEFTSESEDVKIAGVEGGAHAAFAHPPYYDPAALSKGRIILAAFNTGKDLPAGRTRVATLHLHVRGGARPDWSVKVEAAADAGGSQIPVKATVVER
jgi:hypothetical protein